MILNVKLDEGAVMPTKAHETDAGFDLYCRKSVYIPPAGSCVFDTGVHIAIPEGYVGFLKSKSGLNVNHCIQSEGVIDSGYTGSILVKLYNHSDVIPYMVEKGQKISQLVILPILQCNLVEVNTLDSTERGDKGFGSSGK